jgi:CRP-like cAMP-binding protein
VAQRPRQSDITNVLGRIPLFGDLAKSDLRLLSRLVTTAHVADGATVAEQGVLGREAMIIQSGTVAVRRAGREIARLGPGDFFGEMSLINRTPRTADVIATSDVTLLVMDAREFVALLEEHPKVAVKILKTVVARLMENHTNGF